MLEFEEYKSKLNAAKPTLEVLRGALKLEAAQKEIEELEAASERPDFWNDVENSQKVQKRLKTLKNKCENYQKLCSAWDDMYTMCEMAIEENDDSMLEELESEYKNFSEKAESMRLGTLLTGEYDANNALLTLHPGAGGTEAQDWASMLYRMYVRWAERHGYKYTRMATRRASSPRPSRSRATTPTASSRASTAYTALFASPRSMRPAAVRPALPQSK